MTAPDIREAMPLRQASASPWNRTYLPFFRNHQHMLISCSSGIYVPDSDRWLEKFRGIGIRIEDSVCVGDDHPIVLTPEAVKEVCLCPQPSPSPSLQADLIL